MRRKLYRFRAGAEGLISWLKRTLALGQSRWKGDEGFPGVRVGVVMTASLKRSPGPLKRAGRLAGTPPTRLGGWVGELCPVDAVSLGQRPNFPGLCQPRRSTALLSANFMLVLAVSSRTFGIGTLAYEPVPRCYRNGS